MQSSNTDFRPFYRETAKKEMSWIHVVISDYVRNDIACFRLSAEEEKRTLRKKAIGKGFSDRGCCITLELRVQIDDDISPMVFPNFGSELSFAVRKRLFYYCCFLRGREGIILVQAKRSKV